MFGRIPFFIHINRYGQRFGRPAGGWLLMAPGLALVLFGLAILIWPELLAYMVASLLLFVGLTLLAWGWQMKQAQRQMEKRTQNGYNEIYYEEIRF